MAAKKGSKRKHGQEEARLSRILDKYRKPGAMEEIERPAQQALAVAAKEHDEILRRSLEMAHTRVFRACA